MARRSLIAALVLLGLVAGGLSHAANNGVQGAKKEEGGIDIDAPTAILIEAKSGSVLFEKNADQPVAPSSMLKLMTAEFVFNALRKGDIKGSDQYVVSENAWRRGGAPAGGPTMFAAIHSRVGIDDLLRGMIIDNGNDSAMVLAEGMAGNEREFAAMLTKRAREIGLEQSTFANATGMSDPGNKMSVRDIAKLARHVIQTYPDYYKLYNEREFIWNKIRQQNRNPLLNAMSGSDGLIAGSTKDGGYRSRHLGRARWTAAGLSWSMAWMIRTIVSPKPRSCWTGDFAAFSCGRCSSPARGRLRQGVWRLQRFGGPRQP